MRHHWHLFPLASPDTVIEVSSLHDPKRTIEATHAAVLYSPGCAKSWSLFRAVERINRYLLVCTN